MSSIIHLHEQDNVGVCKAALPAGITLIENNLTLRADIPAMHKVALVPIAKGDAILKYGQVIGFANTDIAPRKCFTVFFTKKENFFSKLSEIICS